MAETKRGTYTGPLPNMKGRKATLTLNPGSHRVMAQFDEGEAGYLAPTDFALEHFEIEDEANG